MCLKVVQSTPSFKGGEEKEKEKPFGCSKTPFYLDFISLERERESERGKDDAWKPRVVVMPQAEG